MKNGLKIFIAIAVLFLIAAVAAGVYFYQKSIAQENAKEAEEAAVRALIESFGKKLKNVSLLSMTASDDIEQNYKEFVSPDLLNRWKTEPFSAPGRETSSPWPDGIIIGEIHQQNQNAYEVSGKIINTTSSGAAPSRSFQATVLRIGENRTWLISNFVLGAYSNQ
ncbi:MAG TPA: hypothetical protein PLF16_00415 [Candidatus Staskawiczbacteria bacterium]|nr:hypothetical protein [Candidatus Staskawiczbacteria bacterium]